MLMNKLKLYLGILRCHISAIQVQNSYYQRLLLQTQTCTYNINEKFGYTRVLFSCGSKKFMNLPSEYCYAWCLSRIVMSPL